MDHAYTVHGRVVKVHKMLLDVQEYVCYTVIYYYTDDVANDRLIRLDLRHISVIPNATDAVSREDDTYGGLQAPISQCRCGCECCHEERQSITLLRVAAKRVLDVATNSTVSG